MNRSIIIIKPNGIHGIIWIASTFASNINSSRTFSLSLRFNLFLFQWISGKKWIWYRNGNIMNCPCCYWQSKWKKNVKWTKNKRREKQRGKKSYKTNINSTHTTIERAFQVIVWFCSLTHVFTRFPFNRIHSHSHLCASDFFFYLVSVIVYVFLGVSLFWDMFYSHKSIHMHKNE